MEVTFSVLPLGAARQGTGNGWGRPGPALPELTDQGEAGMLSGN